MNNKRKIMKALMLSSMLLMQGMKGNTENDNILNNSIENKYFQDKGYLTCNVNFRTGAGTNYDIINVLKSGTIVDIIGQTENGWSIIEYNNTIGYISSLYINLFDINKINQQISMLPTSYKTLTATTEVNIRSIPSTEGKKLGKLKKGEQVIYSKKLDNGWYECLNNDEKCYICGDYLVETNYINGKCQKIVFLENDSPIFDYPFSNVIDNAPKYEIAKVYGEVANYYYVEVEDNIGFIEKSNCIDLKDKFIVVDISSQTLVVYNDVDEILKSSVVSGKNSTPTDLGYYSIYSKEKNRTLIGADYKSFVKYWMPYNGGEGLHDASWRSKFGGDIYIKKGSHGCVNLPEKFAKELYNEISVGDKVLIKK